MPHSLVSWITLRTNFGKAAVASAVDRIAVYNGWQARVSMINTDIIDYVCNNVDEMYRCQLWVGFPHSTRQTITTHVRVSRVETSKTLYIVIPKLLGNHVEFIGVTESSFQKDRILRLLIQSFKHRSIHALTHSPSHPPQHSRALDHSLTTPTQPPIKILTHLSYPRFCGSAK